jgi:PKD repeat protein
VATASASPTAGDAPTTVNFTGSASSGTAPYSYAWTFGDGGTSSSQNPSHSYTSAGSYSVGLTVTDAAGHTASATALSVIISPPLSAGVGANPTSGNVPLAVSFTGTPSGGRAPYTYAWSFGDGGVSASQSPSHTYTVAGTYTARLTVTDANGALATASTTTITVNGPLAASASALPTAGDAPLAVDFHGSSSGGTSPYTYTWTFGDGTSAAGQNPVHTYTSAATYVATLTVTDATAQQATSAAPVTVYASLTGSASGTPATGQASLTVAFSGSAAGGKAPYAYAWSFGDGSSSTLQNPSHTYSAAGIYIATLTVTDATGRTAAASLFTVSVSPGPLMAAVVATPAAGDAPLVTTLTGSATGGRPPFIYTWDLGDGTSSTLQSPSHTYSAPGSYTVSLTISDGDGQSALAATHLIVYPALKVSVSATPTSGTAPLPVSFTASVTGGLAPYSVSWEFGDTVTGSGQSTTHSYAAGTFHPSLTVRDAAGGTWAGAVGTISATSPPNLNAPPAGPGGEGPQASPPVAASSPPATPTPSAEPSPPVQESPAPPSSGSPPPASGSGGSDNSSFLPLVIGSSLVTGLGGYLFLAWRRRRSGP